MASTTPKMLLRLWDQLSDLFSHDQLADNFSKIDFHDHTPGRGVQIPTEGLFDGSITTAKLATAFDPAYRKVSIGAAGLGTASVAGTYITAAYKPFSATAASTSGKDGVFYFDPADWGLTVAQTRLKLSASLMVNGTAPACNFTFGLYPVTALVSGAATLGTVIAGSTFVITTPALNSRNQSSVASIPVPAAGFYLVGFVTSATSAAGSDVSIRTRLMMK